VSDKRLLSIAIASTVGAAIVGFVAQLTLFAVVAPRPEPREETPAPPVSSSPIEHNAIFETVPVSGACDAAMAEAASVPASLSNDAEIALAADACLTANEFASAIRAHPDVIGLSGLTDQDIQWAMQAICFQVPSSATCTDAASRGLI